ncbi:hypothetical protein SGRA_2720 [Saprospira grandis str. Lewin]|uniref:Uncharacterized protein n=1 Tax=Saprospira grandis (strain Lewin) TaxID=984262 RepID=H6L9H2_SAPGL|nr:hypothetical protein SGRA_2720 [Saprospira grandis str. Lewin]
MRAVCLGGRRASLGGGFWWSGLAMRSGWPAGPDRGALAPKGRANSEPRSVAPQLCCGGPKTAEQH